MARANKDNDADGIWRRHGLSLALLAMLVASMVGLVWTGTAATNEERQDHGQAPLTVAEYARSADFVSVTFENWESEFLQMGVFILLSVWLRQKGSAESRPMEDAQEARKKFPKAVQPWPVRAGGVWLRLYENSLAIAFFGLFAVSFVLHFLASASAHNEEQLLHGGQAVDLAEYFTDARFWFESFQNWQSEFLAVLAIVVLTIHLRQKDSPQSKQVEAPHSHTGH